jgi:hypothetical protein
MDCRVSAANVFRIIIKRMQTHISAKIQTASEENYGKHKKPYEFYFQHLNKAFKKAKKSNRQSPDETHFSLDSRG